MNVAIFGGDGYLGQHLRSYLLEKGHTVCSIGRTLLRPGRFDVLVHAACPRNKLGRWNFRAAEQAIRDSFTIEAKHKVLISSMSVYDAPDNEYAQFKRMAERWVEGKGWNYVRLPTLFGTTRPVGQYRGDMGLHQIAEKLAHNNPAYVCVNARRHVARIDDVVHQLETWLHVPVHGQEFTYGVVPFVDIVPSNVERRDGDAGYAPCAGHMMSQAYVEELKSMFWYLVEQIAEGRARAI